MEDENKSNIDEFTDSFTQDEIIQEYKKLLEKYRHLKSQHENDQQRIYELKRNWETATAAESFLTHELEVLTATQSTEIERVQEKFQTEIDVLKKKHSEAVQEVNFSEQRVEEFREENEQLRQRVEELENAAPKEARIVDSGGDDREMQLAKENLELMAKVDECRDTITSSVMTIAERDRHIDILKEQVECLEENLQAKRVELEEKSQLLESSQERVMELNAELAALRSNPENSNRKGNSLFAEVDDQRQQMKKMLAAQKKHYLHMKKCYNESEQEIRRLKRENAAMAKEMQVCASIFLSSDKRYKEKLNERIVQLLKQNEELEKKVIWTQGKLIAVSLDKGINWLDSMLTYCRTETEQLKEQLRSCRLQKGILEEQLFKSQQDLAKWRFEALKSRCIIIDRETLLDEHKIEFKPIMFKISEQELNTVKPEIFTVCSGQKENTIVPEISKNIENQSPAFLSQMNISNTPRFNVQHKQEHELYPVEINGRISSNTINPVNLDTTPISSRTTNSISSMLRTNEASIINRNQMENRISENCSKSTEAYQTDSPLGTKKCTYSKTPFKKKWEAETSEITETKDAAAFEIYEDTVCKMPIVKPSDMGVFSKNCENNAESVKSEENCFEIYKDTSLASSTFKCELGSKSFNASQSCTNDNPKEHPSFFEIYEDTICRLPVVNTHFNDAIKENLPVADKSNNSGSPIETKFRLKTLPKDAVSVLTEHNTKMPSPPQSILVKGRSLLDDTNDNKIVTFSPELTTDIKDDHDEYRPQEKPFRSKSQVSVKRIVIKSNFNNKK